MTTIRIILQLVLGLSLYVCMGRFTARYGIAKWEWDGPGPFLGGLVWPIVWSMWLVLKALHLVFGGPYMLGDRLADKILKEE